ncbi:hypothetical protein BST61_g10936 [Cercospora zeina]
MTGLPPQPLDASPEQRLRADEADKSQTLPKGVVLGPDGKPCKTCTSGAAWRAMMRFTPKTTATTTTAAAATSSTTTQQLDPQQPRPDCPPDVDLLGRSTWTLLHTLTASYPTQPSETQKRDTKQFLSLFSTLYPCWVCAEDFRSWMKTSGNEPRVSNREEFGRWMCEAHNAVNVKLGKKEFDCGLWEERWRTGWSDGSCE